METVTLQGPVVVIPANEYATILNRLSKLERAFAELTRLLEDLDDIKAMHEAESEYRLGDAVSFSALIAEVQAEES